MKSNEPNVDRLAVPIADVVEINPGVDKSKLSSDDLLPFVAMPAVEAETGGIDVSEQRTFAKVKSGFTAFATGDVLFAKITPCMENGKMAIVPSLPKSVGFGSTEFHVLRPTSHLNNRYLYYFVSSASFRHEAQHNMSGAVGQKRVPKGFIENKTIPVPSISEQERIVEKIETLFARLDKGEEAVRDVQKLLTRYRQSVLKSAVTGQLTADWRAEREGKLEQGRDLLARILDARHHKLNVRGKYKEPNAPQTGELPDIPENWTWATFDQLTTIVTKGSSPKWQGFEYVDDGILFVRSQNIGWGDLRFDKKAFLPAEFNDHEGKSIIHEGDVLLNIVGASIGRAAVANNELEGANCNQAVAIIRPVDVSLSDFFVTYLLNPAAQNVIHTEKVDVARANYSLAQIRAFRVPLPPIEEAHEIIERMAEIETRIAALSDWCATELKRSASLRQSILKDAFAGKLVSQDPADEPASDLLARIAAEKPTAKKTRRKSPV